jgi:hypothetical protein
MKYEAKPVLGIRLAISDFIVSSNMPLIAWFAWPLLE